MTTEPTEEYRSTLAGCLIVFGVQMVFVPLDAHVLGASPVPWLNACHAALAAVFGGWMWLRRRTPFDRRLCEGVFILLILPFLPIIWISERTALELGVERDPLMPFQFIMVGIALLAPGRAWMASSLLGLFCAAAVVFWVRLGETFSLSHRPDEPWTMLVYAGVSAGFLAARMHLRTLVRRLAEARADAEALARIARLVLAVRDRANSPLQALEFGAALMVRRYPSEQPLTDALRRSIGKLRDLMLVLSAADQWGGATAGATADLETEMQEAMSAARRAAASPRRGARTAPPEGPLPSPAAST